MVCRGLFFLSALLCFGCVDLSLPPQLKRTIVLPGPDAPVEADGGGGPSSSPVLEVDAAPGDTAPGGVVPDLAPPPLTADASAPLPAGRRCATGADCESGTCADGVCCTSACTAICYSCNQPGMEGTCLPVPAGQDPGAECNQDPVSSCGLDGTCDGSGACRRYPAGTLCMPGTCSNAIEEAARSCNGNGVCQPGTSRSCAPNACAGSSCGTVCGSNGDCQNGFLCEGGICRPKRPTGMACTSNGQCGSGYCRDGICCGTPCTEPCHACNLNGSMGTCTPAADGADPGNDCPAEPASSCGRAGGCNGKGSCRLHPSGTSCAAASCAGSSATTERTCNGSGQCTGGTTTDCGGYACAGAVCAMTCTDAAQCKAGFECLGGSCQMPKLVAPPTTLLLHWKLDEESGTSALDAGPSASHGTYIGEGSTPSPSVMAPVSTFANPRSRAFTRQSRHAIQLATTPAALKPANNFTISVWYQATTLDTSGGAELVSAGNQYLVRVSAANVRFSKRPAGASGSIPCDGAVSGHLDGKWHHVAAVQTPAGMKIYLDGVERCTNTRGEDVRYDGSAAFLVGRHPDSENYDFEGNIDDVRVYSVALSPAEITALFMGGN